jgi:hypothetical protein
MFKKMIYKKNTIQMMNKYFQNEKKIKNLQAEIKDHLIIAKNLTRKIDELKNDCDHTFKDGKPAITGKSDAGHGHIIYTCNVCGQWGSRSWASEYLDLV